MGGAREVCVVTERRTVGRLACPREPALVVGLAGLGVGRPHQRRDREPARPALLQLRECGPDSVVERSFDVAGDHCVPFRSRGRHSATDTTSRDRPRRRRRRAPPASRARDRARPDPRGLRREERHVRADARLERHLRLPPRGSLRLHAASLRVVPGGALLAARALLGRRRARADPRRGRDCAARAADRPPPRLRVDRGRRGARGDTPSVSRLARRARQPRDPGRAPRRRDRSARARRLRAPLAPLRPCHRRRRGPRDPLERAAAPPAPRPRALRGVARPPAAAARWSPQRSSSSVLRR